MKIKDGGSGSAVIREEALEELKSRGEELGVYTKV